MRKIFQEFKAYEVMKENNKINYCHRYARIAQTNGRHHRIKKYT